MKITLPSGRQYEVKSIQENASNDEGTEYQLSIHFNNEITIEEVNIDFLAHQFEHFTVERENEIVTFDGYTTMKSLARRITEYENFTALILTK